MILQLELIYNWIMAVLGSCSDNFGHVVYSVDNIFEFCEMLGGKKCNYFSSAKGREHGIHPQFGSNII